MDELDSIIKKVKEECGTGFIAYGDVLVLSVRPSNRGYLKIPTSYESTLKKIFEYEIKFIEGNPDNLPVILHNIKEDAYERLLKDNYHPKKIDMKYSEGLMLYIPPFQDKRKPLIGVSSDKSGKAFASRLKTEKKIFRGRLKDTVKEVPVRVKEPLKMGDIVANTPVPEAEACFFSAPLVGGGGNYLQIISPRGIYEEVWRSAEKNANTLINAIGTKIFGEHFTAINQIPNYPVKLSRENSW